MWRVIRFLCAKEISLGFFLPVPRLDDMRQHRHTRTHAHKCKHRTFHFVPLTLRATDPYLPSPLWQNETSALFFFYYSDSTIFCRKAQGDHSCFVLFLTALLFISCPLSSFSGSISAEYVIEFEDQGSTQRVWEELKRVEGKKTHASLRLWPYMSYRFRVIAINDVGKSEPSKPSEIHNTAAEGQSQRFVHTSFCFF